MEAIRQNGKIILHSNDGTSMKMIFKKTEFLFEKRVRYRHYSQRIITLLEKPSHITDINHSMITTNPKNFRNFVLC